jgi:CheY-like chemotaxis protein
MINPSDWSVISKPRSQTVLVVDHDPAVGDFIAQLLLDEGYRVRAAPNLDAAVKLLSSVRIDLVVTNYMEPEYRRGDRWPVLEMFKQLASPGTPFIVITTSPGELSQGARQLGVSDLIGKPFDVDSLVERVARAIAQRLDGKTALVVG